MPRIVLSTVPFSTERHGVHNKVFPNIGLSYLCSYLRSHGHDVLLLDPVADGIDGSTFARTIGRMRPLLVGFTCLTVDMDHLRLLADELKLASPKTRLVAGGCHPSARPVQTLEEIDALDFVVVGEGEQTLQELAAALEQGGEVSAIQGLAHRSGGEVKLNPPRPQIENLDELPFPEFQGFHPGRYNRLFSWARGGMLPLTTSRGCPFQCIFCYRCFGNRMRYRSVESVIEEVKRDIRELGARNIFFIDETYSVHQERTAEICEAILANDLQKEFRWLCESRVDAVTPELLRLMKRAGNQLIVYGVESGDDAALDRIRKGTSLEQIRRAFQWTHEAGIYGHATLIIGLPGDTVERIRKTIRLAATLPARYATFSILTPFPGTEVERMARQGEGGLVMLSDRWSDYEKQTGAALELTNIRRRRLELLLVEAYLRFYGHPARTLRILELTDWRNLLKVAYQVLVR